MAAFEGLVEAWTPSVYRVARAYLGESAAPDAVQETFLAAWRQMQRLRDPDRFVAWLHRIAVNHCRSVLRGQARVREIPMRLDGPETLVVAGDLRAGVEASAVLRGAVRRLPDDQRAVIALHYAAGLTIREVAEALQVPDGTVKSRLNAALTTLRRIVDREVA
jgi:RNA polymerase sigma-70 factor (ECF subfamily)